MKTPNNFYIHLLMGGIWYAIMYHLCNLTFWSIKGWAALTLVVLLCTLSFLREEERNEKS